MEITRSIKWLYGKQFSIFFHTRTVPLIAQIKLIIAHALL